MSKQTLGSASNPWAKALLFGALSLGLPILSLAQGEGRRLVNDAVAAMGGADKVMGVKTLLIEGGGHDFEIDQSIRWDELGAQSDVSQIRDYKRAYDLVNNRARFESTNMREYAFFAGNVAAHQMQGLDGTVGYSQGGLASNGRLNRMGQGQVVNFRIEYLRHPVTAVRAALEPTSTLDNLRTLDGERAVDVTVAGPTPIKFTMTFDGTTKLPSRIIRMADSATMGDRPLEIKFTDYRSVDGLQLPTRFTSKMDRYVSADIRILKQSVNGDVGDLTAPASVASAPAPAGGGEFGASGPQPVTVKELAKGIWMVGGTTHHSLLVEFSDHMLMVDAINAERVQAVIGKAKELRPDKPVTQVIMTHHHSDHSGGNRTAVALGVKEIIAQKNNAFFLSEMFSRPHTINPDLYAKTGAKPPKITLIDDEGVVKDGTMTINLYHLLDNNHAATAFMVYLPQAKILTQSDIYMPNDPRAIGPGEPLAHSPWNANLLANINYRKIQVETMAPIHGDIVPYSAFLENTIFMTEYLPNEEK